MTAGNAHLANVIGLNAKEFRLNAGLTLDEVSRAARGRGLKWTESRVADFEAGRVASPSLNTLLAFVLALSDAGCPEATLPKLVGYIPGSVQINDSLQLHDVDIVNLLKGQRAERALNADPVVAQGVPSRRTTRDRKIFDRFGANISLLGKVHSSQGAADHRMSKALNIAPMTLARVTATLWNRSFSEERDRRAGPSANAQKRGQVSRALQSELEIAIEEALRGNDH
jgi:transcriptional regulator with XRE-family HTH domain